MSNTSARTALFPPLPNTPATMIASLSRRTWWLVFVAIAIAWFAMLDVRVLLHPDEGRYAEIAREMAVSGDWLTPRLNGLKYFEKPPLQYWVTAAAFNVFEIDEWTARLAPALAGFLAILLVGFTAQRMAGPDAGIYAALVLAGSIFQVALSHYVTLDAVLEFWLTAGLCAFLLAQRDGLTWKEQRGFMLLAYAAIAGATLTKGLVALVIPAATLVLYTLVTRDTGPWKRLHAVPGVALFFALTAPWFLLVSAANPEFAQFFFIHEHFERFLTTEHRRTGGWYYFIPLFLFGILPWLTIFAWTLAPRVARHCACNLDRIFVVALLPHLGGVRVRLFQHVRIEAPLLHPADDSGACHGDRLAADTPIRTRTWLADDAACGRGRAGSLRDAAVIRRVCGTLFRRGEPARAHGAVRSLAQAHDGRVRHWQLCRGVAFLPGNAKDQISRDRPALPRVALRVPDRLSWLRCVSHDALECRPRAQRHESRRRVDRPDCSGVRVACATTRRCRSISAVR